MESEVFLYYTVMNREIKEKRLEHLVGEILLETGLKEQYGKDLRFEPRGRGEFGKPFFTLEPKIHYNISHSGAYVICAFASQEIGVDIQEHRNFHFERVLSRIVPEEMVREILDSEDPVQAFYTQWTLREAYVKWTGQGLSQDLRTIAMDRGEYLILPFAPDYTCAVWTRTPVTAVTIEIPIGKIDEAIRQLKQKQDKSSGKG